MDSNFKISGAENINKTEFEESMDGNNQDVIVVDGRGYERNSSGNKEIHNLVDIVENAQAGDILYEEIMKKSEEIISKIAREIVPEITERIIKEEIEKIKKNNIPE